MASTALRMTALGVEAEQCAGCLLPFRRGAQMNAMEYDDGTSAGWHCDECVATWKTRGEDSLPRWKAEEPTEAAT